MSNDEFNKVELPALHQLQQLGWQYIPGAELSPENGERPYVRDVVLINRLDTAIKRLNPWISEENLRKVSRLLTHPLKTDLIEYNQHLWDMLFGEGIAVDQDTNGTRRSQTVTLIDHNNPDNNEFLYTNQFKVSGVNQNIIPDIICFVNGLPLVVIECKSPYESDPINQGIDQLRRYANLRRPNDNEGAEKLFWYNQLMISTCRDNAKLGTISAANQHYGYWKDAYPFTDEEVLAQLKAPLHADTTGNTIREANAPWFDAQAFTETRESVTELNPMQRMLAGVFDKKNFLDIVQNFIIFELDDGKLIKKATRYQQYRAVNKVIEKLKNGTNRKEKSGVIWHTQGSGKSLTMVMLAIKMRRDPILSKYKLLFVTDRTQLDSQLSNTFRNAQGETVLNAGSVAELKTLLERDSSDIVTTTVQKFADLEKEESAKSGTEGFKDLNTSENIIVLADEAHRTQFGSLAMTINAALPNAPKIGFTGTPLLKTQKMGEAFGGYIDEYRIGEAVDDGATVRLLYEGREALTQVAGDSLDSLFEQYFADKTADEQREIKKKYGVDRAVREAPARVRRVCIDLVEHYRTTIQPDGYKAMIVVGSRHAATVYKAMLDEIGAPPSEVIISGDHNDFQYLAQYTDSKRQKQIIRDFKKPLTENPVAFLIVKDMLLTGFDAPIAQVMYIDRSLKDHTLMQAIARVNRTYKQKACGYVVDYYGLSDNLSEAMELFSREEVDGTYHTLKDEIPKLKSTHTRALSFLKGSDLEDVDACVLLFKEEEQRAQFDLAFKRFAKQMNIVLPDASAKPFMRDLRQLGKIHNAVRSKFYEAGMDMKDIGEKVRQLVDEHILSTGVDPKIPPVDLLAANFKEQVAKSKSPESQAAEVESAIKAHIDVNIDEDPEFYKSLSLRLRDVIEKTSGKWEQQIELLLEIVDGLPTARGVAASELNLSETEFAFYNILLNEVNNGEDTAVIDPDQQQAITDTTRKLVEMFEETTQIVDVFNKPDQIKSMKKSIKRAVVDQPFYSTALNKALQERFIDLAKHKYRQSD